MAFLSLRSELASLDILRSHLLCHRSEPSEPHDPAYCYHGATSCISAGVAASNGRTCTIVRTSFAGRTSGRQESTEAASEEMLKGFTDGESIVPDQGVAKGCPVARTGAIKDTKMITQHRHDYVMP